MRGQAWLLYVLKILCVLDLSIQDSTTMFYANGCFKKKWSAIHNWSIETLGSQGGI